MRVGIIGCGVIGTFLAKSLDKLPNVTEILLMDRKESASRSLSSSLTKARVATFDTMLEEADLIVESASQEAVRKYIPRVLQSGIDVVVMSVGALADDELREQLLILAEEKGGRLLLPSGAICGLDGVKAAVEGGVEEVRLITTKPPSALCVQVSKREVLFDGPAREAIAKFPQNINVAAALSLAGVGFEKTMVRIVADPAAETNTHRIELRGRSGKLIAVTENVPSEESPRTSMLAAFSALAIVKRILSPMTVGT